MKKKILLTIAFFTGMTGKFFFQKGGSAFILTLISSTMLTGLGVSVFVYAFLS